MLARRRNLVTFVAVLAAAAITGCASGPDAPPVTRVLASAAQVSEPAPFVAEPTRRETFSGSRAFSAGARLRFVSFSLSSGERLRLQRCGSECSTAKLVASWGKAEFDTSPVQEIVLAEGGDYYLWLRQEFPGGEVGAAQALAGTFDRENGILRFASGAVVFVAIDGPGMPVDHADDPLRVGTAVIQDAYSELRKLESPAILEKARHGVKQELIVQIDAGEFANALLRETFLVPGDNFPPDAATVSRRQAAMQKYQAALLDAKQRMLVALPAHGVEMTHDFDSSPLLMVTVPSEEALRALQSAAPVTVISENHRVVPS